MKLIRLVIIIGALIASVVLVKNIVGISSVRNRVSDAQRDVDKLAAEQADIRKKLEAATSSAFVERVARDKLGLAKEGETVVVLPSEDFLKSLAPALESGEKEIKKLNWQKWWKKFF